MLDGYQDGTGKRRRAGLLTERGRFLFLLLVAIGLLFLFSRVGGCRAFTEENRAMAKICSNCPGNVFLVDGECPKCVGRFKRPSARQKAAEVADARRVRRAEQEPINLPARRVRSMRPAPKNWGRTG